MKIVYSGKEVLAAVEKDVRSRPDVMKLLAGETLLIKSVMDERDEFTLDVEVSNVQEG